jgi:hypothetical protein
VWDSEGPRLGRAQEVRCDIVRGKIAAPVPPSSTACSPTTTAALRIFKPPVYGGSSCPSVATVSLIRCSPVVVSKLHLSVVSCVSCWRYKYSLSASAPGMWPASFWASSPGCARAGAVLNLVRGTQALVVSETMLSRPNVRGLSRRAYWMCAADGVSSTTAIAALSMLASAGMDH